MLFTNEDLYNFVSNIKYINIFEKYINNINNDDKLTNFLYNINDTIINDFKIITNKLHIGYMCHMIHTNYANISSYYANGLYLIEDYEWKEEEIIKEFIILLCCTYYENKYFHN